MDSFKNFLSKLTGRNNSDSTSSDEAKQLRQATSNEKTLYFLESAEGILDLHLKGTKKYSSKDLIDAIKSLAEAGTMMHVPTLTGFCVNPDFNVRKQAWTAVDSLLRDTPIHMYPLISSYMREQGVLVESTFKGIERDMPVAVVGMLSFNRNGFVREVAMKDLVQRFDGKELPFIIIAANDWVANIHVLAAEALNKRTAKHYAPFLTENLALFQWLSRSGRHQFGRLLTDIEDLIAPLLTVSDLPGLFANTSERKFWRYAFKLSISDQSKSPEEFDKLLKLGLQLNDSVIQQLSATTALNVLSRERLNGLIPLLLRHEVPQVRREALRWIVENKWENFEEQTKIALFDKSLSVRLLAQYYTDKTKIIPLYEQNLEEKKFSLEGTLRGLLDMKVQIASEKIEPFLHHSNSKVRAIAYSLLLRETAANEQQLVVQALSDRSGYCTRVALNYLRANRQIMSADQLWNLFSPNAPTTNARAVLNAIANLGTWRSLEYLLLARLSVQPELEENLDYFINKWSLHYSEKKLSSEQHERCMKALSDCNALVPSEQRKQLEFMLRGSLKDT